MVNDVETCLAVNMTSPLPPGSPGLLRRSMSGNTLANATLSIRRQEQERINVNNGSNIGNAAYRASLVSRYAEDLDRRRRAERAVEECRTEGSPFIHTIQFTIKITITCANF